MIDQESLILTALILGVGYMLVTNTPGVADDPRREAREELEAIKSLKSRAQDMLQRASEFHSQGNLDRLDEPKQDLMRQFIRYTQDASEQAVQYPERRTEIDFMVNQVEKAKSDLSPDTYKRSGESIIEPLGKRQSPGDTGSEERGGPAFQQRGRPAFVQLGYGMATIPEETSRPSSVDLSEVNRVPAMMDLSVENRHNVEVVSGVGHGGGAFNQAPPATSESLRAVEDRVAEAAGANDDTQSAVNSNDPEAAAVNSDQKRGVPIPRVTEPVEVQNYAGMSTGPHNARKVVGENVIRNHEPDLSASAEAHNREDSLQPEAGGSVTHPIEIADNVDQVPPQKPRVMPGGVKSGTVSPTLSEMEGSPSPRDSPVLKRGAEEVEGIVEGAKQADIFSQFAEDPRYQQDMQAALVAKVQAHITHIKAILEGRMRENQRAQFDESLNFIANNMPNNDTVARQLNAWRDGFMQKKGRDVTLPHIYVAKDPVSGQRIGGSAANRDEVGDRARRDREQRNIDLREKAQGEAAMKRKKRRARGKGKIPLDLEQLKGFNKGAFKAQFDAYKRIVDEYGGRIVEWPLKNSNKTFWKNIRSRLLVYVSKPKQEDILSEIEDEENNLENKQLSECKAILETNNVPLPETRRLRWEETIGLIKRTWNKMVEENPMRMRTKSAPNAVRMTPFA